MDDKEDVILYKHSLIGIVFVVGVVVLLPQVSSLHYIAGFVNDSLDGEAANGYVVTLWNPAVGLSDNLTDIIGPGGASGADNIYLIDCDLLSNGCSVGDTLYARVFDNGNQYVTEITSVVVTGAGFDTMPNARLNSLPTVSLFTPADANLTSDDVLSCIASDLDANLANVTLYGDWNGWHANATLSASGASYQANYSVSLPDGYYDWACYASDDLGIIGYSSNQTFAYDTTAPVISGFTVDVAMNTCGVASTAMINCSVSDALTGIEEVFVEIAYPSGVYNESAVLTGGTYQTSVDLNATGTWGFRCLASDYSGNLAGSAQENTSVLDESVPELSVVNVTFSELSPIEGTTIGVNATIINEGCAAASNVLVGLYAGDPDDTGILLDTLTATISNFTTTAITFDWLTTIGTNNLFILADSNDTYSEVNELNNKANATITVTAWQVFYGNITLDTILGDDVGSNVSYWFNESSFGGNVFIVDSEADISWQSLQALQVNASGQGVSNDFTDIDTLLGMSLFDDSVSTLFTSDGSTPYQTLAFNVYQQPISNVPIINSTITDDFVTGVLWDTSDDSDGEYSIGDAEDIVFITKVSQETAGEYGTYDFEMRIPVALREYDASDASEVFIYYDLH